MSDSKLIEYATRLRGLRDQKEKLENELKEVNAQIAALQPLFVELLENMGVTKASVETIGTVYITSDMHVKVEDTERFFSYLKNNGFGDLIKESVHPQTLKAFTKEHLETKNVTPTGVAVYPFREVRIRRT